MPRQLSHYADVVVVGGRVAGAATALLLARRGHRVVLVDRRRPGGDTLSTHALMRGAVLQLKRWGLLERVIDAGTPAIPHTNVHYGDEVESIELQTRAGVGAVYAPRRTVLDSILVEAAAEAGVDVRFGTTIDAVVRDSEGRVRGVQGRGPGGEPITIKARFTVGADGLRSTIARSVDALLTHVGTGSSAVIYAYFAGLPKHRYDWFYRPGVAAGFVPTNQGESCVWVGTSAKRFQAEFAGDLEPAFERLFEEAAPSEILRLGSASRRSRLRGYPGVTGFIRRAWGPGWALVGDASHFKDPISAHGITDSFRDAEFLARAIDSVIVDSCPELGAMTNYQMTRDRLTIGLFKTTDRIASYGWDLTELRGLLISLSREMKREVEELAALDHRDQASVA